MSITLSPSKADYLARVALGLSDMAHEDREEVLQDLEAHLAELDDPEVTRILGSPEAFVDEFRASAGLTEESGHEGPGLIKKSQTALAEWSARLVVTTHWQTVRPVWVWTRGWLLVCAWSLLYNYEGFSRFPIPSVGQSDAVGLIAVVAATALSVWLDGPTEQRWRAIGTKLFSVVAGWALIGMLLNPMPTYSEVAQQYEEQMYFDGLTSADGNPIRNIYAYDLDGKPVEVLLFDQDGRPLLSLPAYVYQDAEIPGHDPAYYDNGTVVFPRDEFGRIIPNLYPLDLTRYDDHGNLEPMPPPSLGIPTPGEDEQAPAVTTTLGYVR